MKIKNTHFVIDEWDFINIFDEESSYYDRFLSDCDGYSTEISIRSIDEMIKYDEDKELSESEIADLRGVQQFIRDLAVEHKLDESKVKLVLLR